MKILLAEDERITRRSLQRYLESWGHDVIAAEDGAVAWQQFQQQQFDIVVTDWDMPKLDGRALIERIRGSGASGYVYLIMLTGRAEKADLVVGMEAGADDFLAKPFDRNELRVRLNAGQRIIRLERELAEQNETLSKANERMSRDLRAAADVQQALLPKELPESLGARFAWHFEPCDELGGDILNVLSLFDRYVVVYLLDVSGHGVPAALLSVTLSRVLTARDPSSSFILAESTGGGPPTVRSPRDVAERLNRAFPMAAQGDHFFTLAYAVLDLETHTLQYTVAGHPPPALVRQGRPARHLEGDGFPVGVVDEPEYEEHRLQLEPGDRLLFYSDGVTEAANKAGVMLGDDGFVRLIEASRDRPLDEGLDKCIHDLREWCDATPLADDISVLALEVAASHDSV